MSITLFLANYNALFDCLFVRIIIHYAFVFRDCNDSSGVVYMLNGEVIKQ